MHRFTLLPVLCAALVLSSCTHDLDSVPLPCAGDCAVVDAGVTDGPMAESKKVEAGGDKGKPDTGKPDVIVPDGPKPDQVLVDAPKPDKALTDAPKPDAPLPDAAVPDMAIPDAPVPDALVPVCNNGTKEAGEQCDSTDYGGQDCAGLGFDFGKLACDSYCKIVTTGCFAHKWIEIEPTTSTFSGAVNNDPCYVAKNNEQRINSSISRGYVISAKEVTRGQYKELMGFDPSVITGPTGCQGSSCPVDNVTWWEAVAYCNQLSTARKLEQCYSCDKVLTKGMKCTDKHKGAAILNCGGFRLPSEVEWEHAYRAGVDTFSLHSGKNVDYKNCTSTSGDPAASAVAYCKYNSKNRTWIGGGKLANKWGIYDMAGNLYEWTQDWLALNRPKQFGKSFIPDLVVYGGTYRVLKGGAFNTYPWQVRGAHRIGKEAKVRASNFGFRCVKAHCLAQLSESFTTSPLPNTWKPGSLVRRDTSAYIFPKADSGKYWHSVKPKKSEGGHYRALTKPITMPAFRIQATLQDDPTQPQARTTVGVFTGTTMWSAGTSSVRHGKGYACTWDADKAAVKLTLVNGSQGETTLAYAPTGSSGDTKAHEVTCARKRDGTWELTFDKNKLIPFPNTKDLTHTKLTHVSLHLWSNTTLQSIDNVYVRDCN